jgi:hypothetical protein
MPIRTKIVGLIISIGMLLLIIELVRRRKLREEYSQLWFITGIVIVLMMVWLDLLRFISHLVGAVNQISTIFFLAFLFLVGISLHFSVVISKLTNQVKDLAQQNALLEGELERLKKRLP